MNASKASLACELSDEGIDDVPVEVGVEEGADVDDCVELQPTNIAALRTKMIFFFFIILISPFFL